MPGVDRLDNSGVASPLDALRAMREALWDRARGMDRYAPGVVPGVDISALHLHATRETVLGAFVDLGDGHVDRAVTALRSVLALQYPLDGRPWDGTFPVAAEAADPPGDDAVEWVHYDPNWRQFIGCALAVCRLVHGPLLTDDVLADIATALDRCVIGEPPGRIADWYTNPNLMHAWLQGHVGATTERPDLADAAHERLGMIIGRFERYGDIDEYNSPTYDGIDLWAIGLWATHPPTSAFAEAAATMLPTIGARVSTLYHPRFGATCGPFIRAYGLVPTEYLSLSGLLFATLGEPVDRVLPSPLDEHTVHVHDLYFAPMLAHVARSLRPHLRFDAVTDERHHEQHFGDARAQHLLRPELAVGWERGRRHEASLDQYVPFTAHVAEADGSTTAVGIMVPSETAWIDVDRTGDLEFRITAAGRDGTVGLRIAGDRRPELTGGRAAVGRMTISTADAPNSTTWSETPVGQQLHVGWDAGQIEAIVTIADPR